MAAFSLRYVRPVRLGLVGGAMLLGVVGSAVDPSAHSFALAGDPKADFALRAKWESIIQLYGQEDTNSFSLRVLDKDAIDGTVAFKSCWKYDPKENKWVDLKVEPREVKIVTADKKPADAEPGSQLISDLPIKLQDVGIYYIKWSVSGVEGAVFRILGPSAPKNAANPGKPGKGQIISSVPIDQNHAELRVIPDPRLNTTEEPEKK